MMILVFIISLLFMRETRGCMYRHDNVHDKRMIFIETVSTLKRSRSYLKRSYDKPKP